MKNCILIILITALLLHAQSVDSLLTHAKKHHPALLAASAKIEMAKAKSQAVDVYPSPTIALEIGQIPYGEWNIVNKANMNNLTISQMFMPGGKVAAMTKAEESQSAIFEQEYQSLLRNFRSEIVKHYLELWQIQQKIAVLEEENQVLVKLEKVLVSKLNYSPVNSGELILLKLEQSENRNKLLNLNNDKQSATARLISLTTMETSAQDFKFNLPEPDSINISLGDLKSGIKDNPDITTMDKMAEMIHLDQIAKNKEQIPDFMVSATFMRMPNGMFVTENMAMDVGPDMHVPKTGSAYMYGLMASFNLPFIWWHNDQFTYQKKAAEIEQESILLNKKSMEHKMFGEIENMYLKQQSAWRNIVFYRKNTLPAYQETIQTQIEQLSAGKGDLKMILEMNKMLLMQKMNYLMAVDDFYMAINDLEKMSGKILIKL